MKTHNNKPPFEENPNGKLVTFSAEECDLAFKEVKYEFARQERFIYLYFDKLMNLNQMDEGMVRNAIPFIQEILHVYKVDLFAITKGQEDGFATFLIKDYLEKLRIIVHLEDITNLIDVYIIKAKKENFTRNNAVSLFSKISHFTKPHLIPIYDKLVREQISHAYANKKGQSQFINYIKELNAKVELSDEVINEHFISFVEFVKQSQSYEEFSKEFKGNLQNFFKIRFIDKLLWSKKKDNLNLEERYNLTNSLNYGTFADNVRIMDSFWHKNQNNVSLSKEHKRLIKNQTNDTKALQDKYPF